MIVRDRLLELSDALNAEVAKPIVSLPAVRRLARQLAGETEQHAVRLKAITDIARFGAPTRRTRQWIAAMETAPDGWTPDAA